MYVASELNFNDAIKYCWVEKSDLASTSSEEEQTFLYKTFFEANPYAVKQIWVGLNDIVEEGVLAWTDESPVTYTRFASHQPNGGRDENCMSLRSNGDFGDIECHDEYHFICKQATRLFLLN